MTKVTSRDPKSSAAAHSRALNAVGAGIVGCERCERLREYCLSVARVKRAAFREQSYWAKPVPGFGDPDASVLVLGLAPAAHGANRTGRVFTGDGVGGSGDFLIAALKRAGFANIDTCQRVDDGLELRDVYIAAAVRCAPPANKPLPEEITACLAHLEREIRVLPNLRVIVALGQIAWNAWLQLLAMQGITARPKPAFAHGAITRMRDFRLPTADSREASDLVLVGCYHPSRQNTNTGKVTPAMYDEVFSQIVKQELGAKT